MSAQTKHYEQLTQSKRYQLQALLKNNLSQQTMADTLGVHKSTISRELRRNSDHDGYCLDAAEKRKTERKKNARKAKKTDVQHRQIIEKGLSLGWSPENISYRITIELPEKAISHITIYRLIAQDKTNGGHRYRKLPRFGKTRWKGGKRMAGRSLIPDRTDITERPAIVEQRTRLGDWEVDTVYGQDAHLVTLVDRKSRLTMIGKVAIKNAETVASKMIEMLQRAPGENTITLDNGKEFAMHPKVSEVVNADVYFAKPYASYQRGTNGKHQWYYPPSVAKKDGSWTDYSRGYCNDGVINKHDASQGLGWANTVRSLYRAVNCTYCINPALGG